MKKNTAASAVIDAIGGTKATADLCTISMPSVSVWRKSGIPKSWTMFLRLAKPDAFKR